MKTHVLKIHATFFSRLAVGEKKFEIRKNDRDFRSGDIVEVREVVPATEASAEGLVETGRSARYFIGYMSDYEQKPGYVVWSVNDLHAVRI